MRTIADPARLDRMFFALAGKVGRVRTYTAESNALDAMGAWVARRRTLLNAQFDRLDAYLAEQIGRSAR